MTVPARGNSAATAQPKLSITHVTKRFISPNADQEIVALQDVSLQAPSRTFICLLGVSGCGKTTLLNLVAGFLDPTEGEVRVDGQLVTGAHADRGVVFQDYALFPWLTVRLNVQFGPRVQGRSQAEQRALADKYLAMVGLSEFENRYPHELSGGMKQRVAIARALANHPSILLLDEPFGALDAMTRETMQDELLVLTTKEPKLVVFVTHSVLEAVFLADRIVVMSARPGRIMADITISLPHPRDRTSAEVTEYVREIRQLIAPQLKEEPRR
ncbi:MAG: ABC transporter ATP-binding protein [Alphaproteobacteria bacterium]|nr:ABC transporter ATP-binding protein [Alphaproteobacteria bacterium]